MEATSVTSYRTLRHDSKYRRKSSSFIVASSRGSNGPDFEGKLVDENMILLRLRIKEMKISESNVDQLPSNWMTWEKQYFLEYNADVCKAMGFLQNFLIDIRPSLGVAVVAIVLLSLPMSTGVTLFHALQLAQGFISRFNPS
ncbi:hypothetical protein REPUB_Repub12eG0022100 [Reevesia pubescens]